MGDRPSVSWHGANSSTGNTPPWMNRDNRDEPVRCETRPRTEKEKVAPLASVSVVQFGWRTRNQTYSVEYEKECSGRLYFDGDRRKLRIRMKEEGRDVTIAIQSSQVEWFTVDRGESNSAVFLSLRYPPTYEEFVVKSSTPPSSGSHRLTSSSMGRRLSAIDALHAAYSPYTSNSIRVIYSDHNSERTLHRVLSRADIRTGSFMYPVDRLELFSQEVRDAYRLWLKSEGFEVAFQLEIIARANILDLQELIRLKPHLGKIKRIFGTTYTAALIEHIGIQAQSTEWYVLPDHVRGPMDPLMRLFVECKKNFKAPSMIPYTDRELFSCYHVKITPSQLVPSGPLPERNNRVMRKYAGYTINFIRVNFTDEDGLQYRVDPSPNGREFVRDHFGYILSNGLDVAGHHFDFLNYSQSGLKSHSMWFVRPFHMPKRAGATDMIEVTASSIIASLGIFDARNSYDPDLIYCPARYAARLAQAFTATDAAVNVEPEEIVIEPDIKDSEGRSFTDGAGRMSDALASDIWENLQKKNPRRKGEAMPDVIQIRFQGCKGTLSRDVNLVGRKIVLRHSMIKFSAPDLRTIEVAAVFNKPAPFYLNRPLIMLLQGLRLKGGYEYLKTLQDAVMQETADAMHSFGTAARLLERHGLGVGYKLFSICLELEKLGVCKPCDTFIGGVLDVAIYHILRDLKYRAHIPVPCGYTLVGIPDPYGVLEEGEVYGYIDSRDGRETFLEGRVMMARSPVIHPGHVQVVKAIGRPLSGSPFDKSPLKNALVFSTKGSCPLPTKLSNGDLDGDTYVCTTDEHLFPQNPQPPAEHDGAKKTRKVNAHPSTRQDVASFVVEYICRDIIAIIAARWLELADRSQQGIFDPRCITLADLHSAAVDYPKTGLPVPFDAIPKSSYTKRPDWSAPETGTSGQKERFYPSQSYIGRLFRAVRLNPPVGSVHNGYVDTPPHAHRGQAPPLATERASTGGISLQQALEVNGSTFRAIDLAEAAVYKLVTTYVHIGNYELDQKRVEDVWTLFQEYILQLRATCVTFSLSQERGAMLGEMEVVAGTILTPASHGRGRKERKDRISRMREQTSVLVDHFASLIKGVDNTNSLEVLRRAWVGFRLATFRRNNFGSSSFRLIALHEIFDTIRVIESIPSRRMPIAK